MNLTTLRYRVKDETIGKHLTKMGYSVNFVWNFCNQSNQERWAKFRKTFSAFDRSGDPAQQAHYRVRQRLRLALPKCSGGMCRIR